MNEGQNSMRADEVISEMKSALEREKHTRGGVVLDCTTVRSAIKHMEQSIEIEKLIREFLDFQMLLARHHILP